MVMSRGALAIVAVAWIAVSTGSATAQCRGDFNHDQLVTVDELVSAVESALNGCQPSEPRFVDNGDGTVADQSTALTWEKKDDGGGLHDKDMTYTWADAMSEFVSEVNGYSADGAAQVGLGGHSDWRLPTRYELLTIVDLSDPHCDQTDTNPCIFPALGPTANGGYWSSTTHAAPNPSNAWGVLFNQGGREYSFGKTGHNYVRAVRGGS